MLSANPSKQQQFARALTLTVFFPLQYSVHQITRAKDLFAENRQIKEEAARLSIELSMLQEKSAENKRLRSLLGFEESLSYRLIPARAVVREPSPLYRSVVINAGARKGVCRYMPALDRNGLAGRIAQVMRGISLVQLLRDPSARTSVMVKRTRTVGILETANGSRFFIRHRRHVDVTPGDTILTSGLGGVYPRGLRVGLVAKVEETHDPLFKNTCVETFVDFEHIEELFVMQLSPQWAAFGSELDSIEFE